MTLKKPSSARSRSPALLLPPISITDISSASTRKSRTKGRIRKMITTFRPESGTPTPDFQGKTMRCAAMRSTGIVAGGMGTGRAGASLRGPCGGARIQELPDAAACHDSHWGGSFAGDAMQDPGDDSDNDEMPTWANRVPPRAATAPRGARCITGAGPMANLPRPIHPVYWAPAGEAPHHRR